MRTSFLPFALPDLDNTELAEIKEPSDVWHSKAGITTAHAAFGYQPAVDLQEYMGWAKTLGDWVIG